MGGFRVIGHGVHGREGAGFQIHRPRGSGDFAFILFHVPIAVRYEPRGEVHYAAPGACMLFTPGHLQWYWGVDARRRPGPIDNSWVHFLGKAAAARLRAYGIPRNRFFVPRGAADLLEPIEAIRRETLRREPWWEARASLLVEDLLLRIGRGVGAEAPGPRARRARETEAHFRKLRGTVHERLERRWTVPEMARMAHLSPSRFAALYRRCFGIAPMDDLIAARLARARELLTNTALPVKQVAAMAGFESIYYFSRIFRQRVGCAPRDYYARAVGPGASERDGLAFRRTGRWRLPFWVRGPGQRGRCAPFL